MGGATCCTRGKLKKFSFISLALKPDSDVIIAPDYILCFYSNMRVVLLHEIAHLYQSAFPASPTRLLSEGGATAMSYTAEYELGYINEYVYRLKFQNARTRCVKGMDEFVQDALSFHEMLQKRNSLNYDCGAALIDLILKAYPEETIYSFWKKLSITSESYVTHTNLKIVLALKGSIPKTAFLNELNLFLIDPHPDPMQSFLDLEAAISIPNPTPSL